jgi:hypothetical protein
MLLAWTCSKFVARKRNERTTQPASKQHCSGTTPLSHAAVGECAISSTAVVPHLSHTRLLGNAPSATLQWYHTSLTRGCWGMRHQQQKGMCAFNKRYMCPMTQTCACTPPPPPHTHTNTLPMPHNCILHTPRTTEVRTRASQSPRAHARCSPHTSTSLTLLG